MRGDPQNMRIVQIEDFFHPNAGYQINILSKYFVKQGHEVIIITGELDKIPDGLTAFFGRDNIKEYDDRYAKETGVRIVRLPLIKYISGRGIFYNSLEKTVEKLHPDILFIHDVHTFVGIKYILKVNRLNYPIIYDSHMLEIASVNRFKKQYRWFYRTFITPKIIKNKLKVIRIEDDDYMERVLGVPLEQCPFISVGSDMLLFHPDYEIRRKFRMENDISEDTFVIIYAGKLDEAKGGMLLAEASQKSFSTNKKVAIVIVGNTSGEYGKKVDEVFATSENRIIRFPTQQYVNLPKYFQAADLAVFPRQCSLSFYDAQACGIPVVSEDISVNIDRLQYNNGFIFKAGNVNDFREKILYCINMPEREYNAIKQNAFGYVKEQYNYEKIAKSYTDAIIGEVNKFRAKKGD
jgi:glycosyltransferase involved in cell wall biosynthesis